MASLEPTTAVQQQQLEQQGEHHQQKLPKVLCKEDRVRVVEFEDASCVLIYRHKTHWRK